MKFLVDKLPFYREYCPFYQNCPDSNIGDCPRDWDKYDIEHKDHECSWLKEYQEKTGCWIKYDEGFYVTDKLEPVVHSIRECSECHTKIADFSGELKYCPNCKVRMERTIEG